MGGKKRGMRSMRVSGRDMNMDFTMVLLRLCVLLYMIKMTCGLVGYDCAHHEAEATSISTFGTTECYDINHQPKVIPRYIQVLNVKKHDQLEYYHCTVLRSSLIFRCGQFDHVMLVPSSLSVEDSVDISTEECDLMVKTGRYITITRNVVEGIKVGGISKFQVTDVGTSNHDGSCEGATLIHQGVTYTKAVKVSQYKILVTKNTDRRIKTSNTVVFPDGLECTYNTGGCYTSLYGRRIWTVKEEHFPCGNAQYDLLYEGWSNETKSSTAPLVYTVESTTMNFAISTKYSSIICGHQGHKTDDDKIVIKTGKPGELPHHSIEVDTYDINPFLDTNLKFAFLERTIANRTEDLYHYFLHENCELNKSRLRHLLSLARTNPQEFAWVYTEEPGFTAITRGEVIHLIKCKSVSVQPRHTTECYDDLPVTYQNSSYFLTPGSRLLVKIGKPVLCSALTHVLYLIDGVWIKVGGESYIAPTPINLSPNPSDVWEDRCAARRQSPGGVVCCSRT